MGAFLPPVPKIDKALLSEDAGIELWQKRSSASPNDHRRVSTVGAAVSDDYARSMLVRCTEHPYTCSSSTR